MFSLSADNSEHCEQPWVSQESLKNDNKIDAFNYLLGQYRRMIDLTKKTTIKKKAVNQSVVNSNKSFISFYSIITLPPPSPSPSIMLLVPSPIFII